MIQLHLSDIAQPLQAVLTGQDVEFYGCSTDTRTLQPAELFIALEGGRFDGHSFVAQARESGAAAAMLEHPVDIALPALVVGDTRAALGQLAALWRGRFTVPIVAITGSNGKTTVKEMLAAILSLKGAVLATRGNLNNDIGVPQTLCRLGEQHDYAVIELGANHPGEIARLCELTRPTVSVITQCAPAHLEGFGSVEGVARAKGELFAGLTETGVAVINADDGFAGVWQRLAGARRQVSFGLETQAEVSARGVESGLAESRFRLITPEGSTEVRLLFPGRHNVMNALAAAGCAYALGIEPEAIARGLSAAQPVPGRLNLCQGPLGVRLLDDTYNANPGSLKTALEVLAGYPGDRWLVLGDMGELGPEGQRYHREGGLLARRSGVSRLYAVGELSRYAVEGFGRGGRHFSDIEGLVAALNQDLHKEAALLIKGSRSMRMERVVRSLQQDRRS